MSGETNGAQAGRLRGMLKWFNRDKGYGFIVHPAGRGDVFLHAAALPRDDKGVPVFPAEDQEILFNAVEKEGKGLRAVDVSFA